MDKIVKSLSSLDEKVNSIKHQNVNQSQPTPPKKKKILLVGDSLSRNANISVVKNVMDMDVKRVEAFIMDKDDVKARNPSKNFMETVPRELEKDDFSTLIIQGGTNEVSNLDVSGDIGPKIETLKEEIKASSTKMFNIAEDSLKNNNGLEKVILLKRIFRCDNNQSDPSQIKAKLSEFGNRVLDDLWLSKGCPKNIIIAQQQLECEGDLRVQRFGMPSS